METFLQNFKLELLGNVLLSSYLAWFILSLIGSVTATLIRNNVPTIKSYPVNAVQLLTSLLITFIFIRFSLELTGLVPSAVGALVVGLGGNELALQFLKKYLNKKKEESEEKPILNAADEEIGGGGIKNPPKPPTEP